MKEPYYTIREASERVGVESHVLRYWEEELKMDIHRNQMGHRYYTCHDIDLLCMIKKLKDKGLQLKAIRSYIDKRKEQLDEAKKVSQKDCTTGDFNEETEIQSKELVPVKSETGLMTNEEKLEQFQRIMNRILSNAIVENNDLIGRSAGEHAANAVVTQIQGMTKEQEERAEARYRKLDQTLREIQLARKEAAAANMRPVDKRRQQRLKRKNKQQGVQGDEQDDNRIKGESVNESENKAESISE